MSHYDYLSPHMAGLAGPVEDLASAAVKGAAAHVGSNREAAWNYFRFGVPDISASAAEGRIKGWEANATTAARLTTPFKTAMDALKSTVYPLDSLTKEIPPKPVHLNKFSLAARLKIQEELKKMFDAEWAKAFPSSAPTSPFSRTGMFTVPRLPTLPLAPAGAGASSAGSSSTGGDDDKKSSFPVVPVAIGAAALAAILLMRKK
jgi:hypothetical protein